MPPVREDQNFTQSTGFKSERSLLVQIDRRLNLNHSTITRKWFSSVRGRRYSICLMDIKFKSFLFLQ